MENDGPLPDELLEAYLCDRYRILPSVLDGEDVMRLLRADSVLAVWHTVSKDTLALKGKEAKLMWSILDADWKRKHG